MGSLLRVVTTPSGSQSLRVALTDLDGHAVYVWDGAGAVLTEELTGLYGNPIEGYGSGTWWELDGLHGTEEDRTNEVTQFGTRHTLFRDGLWMQPEPLLGMGLRAEHLVTPQKLGPVYAGGNPVMQVDRDGYFSLMLAMVGCTPEKKQAAAPPQDPVEIGKDAVRGLARALDHALSDRDGPPSTTLQDGAAAILGDGAAAGGSEAVGTEQVLSVDGDTSMGVETWTASGTPITKHGVKRMEERGFTDDDVDRILAEDEVGTWSEKHGTWQHKDRHGNTVGTRPEDGAVTTVFSPEAGGDIIR